MRRALVIEDQDLMRQALIVELKESLGDCIIAGAQTFALAHRALTDDLFDLVLIDPGLPGFDPTSSEERLKVIEAIVQAAPSAIHIVITGSDNDKEAVACRELGVSAYLGKTGFSRGGLGNVLDQVARDEFSLRYSKANAQFTELHISGLTPRESRITELMMQRRPGERRKDVFARMAEELRIEPASAERYFKQARAKLMRSGRLPRGL
ncbi:response regulator [Aminobacter aganoensis]|uniref:DNA-binding NarL/FixJ family response regulator n=1 Tax=Aminobacter aganoensis TaxID=83264 RepID=A0A7X0F9M2_9HYPH|nr:response regulator [Aminobacter aganoensis]MBB6355687.1 DNA-binding NarL/FixJ family response regulator [Aminobacter aganoensis]